MKILSLETSTEYCSVALWQDGIAAERFELVGQKHSERLIGMLDELLGESRLAGVDAIAYGAGPGSFTGVRIACGAVQGLALGASLPVIGICTLQALAQGVGKNRVIAALDARMGEIYFAAYERSGDDWTVVCEPCLCKPEEAPVPQGDGWFGAGSGFTSDRLRARCEGRLDGMDQDAVPRALHIAALGALRFADAVDSAQALPFYLRDKVALKTVERERLALEKAAAG